MMRRRLARLAIWAGLSLAIYVTVAVLGSVIRTSEAGGPIALDGPRIWVIAGPIHTDIVVPMRFGAHDLSPLVAPPAFSADEATLAFWRGTVSHVAVSWGSRDFFAGVPTLDKVRPWHVIRGLWDEGAMHLTLMERPWEIVGAVEIALAPAQYDTLMEEIAAGFVGGLEAPVPIAGMGYSSSDGFYESAVTYHAFRTCNVWTARVLAKAGVSVGVWTPLPQGLMWSLRRGRQAANEGLAT